MARQRMVKPEFFDSASLASCSIAARLAFIGLWVEADDYGRFKAQPLRLKTCIFPYDRMGVAKFVSLLGELEAVGCIKGYEIDGEKYAYIPNFNIYQTVNRPSKSSIPEPPKSVEKVGKTTLFSECSMSTHAKERKKEGSVCVSKRNTNTNVESAKSAGVAESAVDKTASAPLCADCNREAYRNQQMGAWVCPVCNRRLA